MLGPMLWKHLGLSEDEAMARIKTLEEKELMQFAISESNEPAVFSKGSGYSSEEEEILVSLLVDFWDTTGDFNSKNGRICVG